MCIVYKSLMNLIIQFIKKALEIWCSLVTLIINAYKTTETFESVRPNRIKHGNCKRNRTRLAQEMYKKEGRNKLKASSTKITDLNSNCLVKILSYLTIDEMLSVAHSNNYLKEATKISFKKVYGNSLITLLHDDENYIVQPEKIKKSLQFLRCFGPLISRVEIETNRTINRSLRKHLTKYLAKYCSNSLVEIWIDSITYNLLIKLFEFEDLFPNVKTVWFDLHKTNVFDTINACCFLSEYFIFPFMEHLTIILNYDNNYLENDIIHEIFEDVKVNIRYRFYQKYKRTIEYCRPEPYSDQIFPESGSGPVHRKMFSKKQMRRMDF